jgi:hypothetical protein
MSTLHLLVIHVVGNKLDLAPTMRAIPLSRTLEYVSKTLGEDCEVHEVSAKDDEGKAIPEPGNGVGLGGGVGTTDCELTVLFVL